ncbi:S8 family serine peptidase [Tautonia sociabilis]|uniref:Peptidase S8/S53 domain-containing protein n=1 Tax=Tautonia sociabilis TaxID=2080755 RepID=A0A432MN88_9BACT|nr:S8 family serine peptidase [Tautonia sociabilis]RUL88709.1 hypothetical protein TsocGM_06120 [Tautonia sociabilis]
MRVRRPGSRPFRLERLEERTLLSGGLGEGRGPTISPGSYAPGRILVGWQDPQASGRPAGVEVITLPEGVGVDEAVASFRTAPGVRFAEPDSTSYRTASLPNDPYFSLEYFLRNTGQSGGSIGADIGIETAWNVTTGSSDVTVAIIDTGVDTSHVELAGNIWTNIGEIPNNSIDDDNNGYVDDVNGWDFVDGDNIPQDDDSHGTHMAGIIGALSNNAIGVAGINWSVSIMPLRVIGPSGTSSSDIVSAIEYAVANGADIINMSFESPNFSQAVSDAIDAAVSAGVLIVASAGNDAQDNDTTPRYPASYASNGIISVAATDRNDNLSSTSNSGATSVDVVAPGVSILSLTPGNTYSFLSGTSQAAAQVSGAAALLKAEFPSWTGAQIKAQLLATVDPIEGFEEYVATGGRIDVGRALTELGPRVSGLLPGVAVSGPIRVIRTSFTFPIDPTSFDASDVAVTDPSSNSVSVQQVRAVPDSNDQLFDIVLASAQSAVGSYGVTIGPDILNPLTSQTMTSAYVGSVTIRDSSPPTFVSATPSGATTGPVSVLQLSFSEPMDITSMSAQDFQILGPNGAVNVSSIDPAGGGTLFDLAIDEQSADGDYLVRIGRQITDLAGNALASAASFHFTLGAVSAPSVSSVSPGSTVSGPVRVLRVTFSEAIDASSFTVDDVSLSGPGGSITPSRIHQAGPSEFSIIIPSQSQEGTYTLQIGPNIADLAGAMMEAPHEASFTILDTSAAPQLASALPGGTINGPVRIVRVTFDRPMAPYWFLPQFITATGPSGLITVERVRPVDGTNDTQFDIRLPSQSASGDYSVSIGTAIRSRYGIHLTEPVAVNFTIR